MNKPLFMLLTAIFLFTSLVGAYTVNGEVQEITSRNQDFYIYHASPENSSVENLTLTGIIFPGAEVIQDTHDKEVDFGHSTNGHEFAQVFQFSNVRVIESITVNISKKTTPTDSIYVSIEGANASGAPNGTVYARSIMLGSGLNPTPSTFQTFNITPLILPPNVNFTLVLNRSGVSGTGSAPYFYSVSINDTSNPVTSATGVTTFGLWQNSTTLWNVFSRAQMQFQFNSTGLKTTSPLITSSNDTGTLDFAVYRNETRGVATGMMTFGQPVITPPFNLATFNASWDSNDPADDSYLGLAFGATFYKWAGTGVNTFRCLAENATTFYISDEFVLPNDVSEFNIYQIKQLPNWVECWFNGMLVGRVNVLNHKSLALIANGNSGTVLNISYVRLDNVLPNGAVVNVLANGSGNYTYTGIGVEDIWANVSGIPLYWTPFISPLGSNHSYFTATFDEATNSNFSNDGKVWYAYTSGTLTTNNTHRLFVRFNQTPTTFTFSSNFSNKSNTNLPIIVPGNNTLAIFQSVFASNRANITYTRDEIVRVEYLNQLLESASSTGQAINLVPNSAAALVSNVSGVLFYDGRNEGGTQASVFNTSVSRNATATSANTTHSFVWIVNVSLPSGNWTYMRENVTFNQYVYQVNSTNCSFGGTPTLNFTTLIEENQTTLSATQNAAFNFTTNDDTITRTSVFNVSNTQNLTVCLPPNMTSANVTSFQDYAASGYSLRYHFLRNAEVTTTLQTIPLLLEPTTQTTNVQFQIQDSNSLPIEGLFVQISRYFPSQDAYVQVAQIISGQDGKATVPLRTNDMFYQFIVTNTTGEILASYTQQLISCPLTTCIVLLPVFTGNSNLLMYQVSGSTSWACVDSNSSINCTVVDTSGLARGWNLTIYRPGIMNTTTACSVGINTPSGALSCVIPLADSGLDNYYSLQVNFNPNEEKLSGVLSKADLPIYGLSGVLAGLLIIISFVLVTIRNPAMSVLAGAAGLMITGLLGLIVIPLVPFTGIIVAALIIAWLMKT